MKMDIVDFAYQVIDMQKRITHLEIENQRLKLVEDAYQDLLDSSLKDHQVMMGNILKLCLTPGVVKACQENATFGVEE